MCDIVLLNLIPHVHKLTDTDTQTHSYALSVFVCWNTHPLISIKTAPETRYPTTKPEMKSLHLTDSWNPFSMSKITQTIHWLYRSNQAINWLEMSLILNSYINILNILIPPHKINILDIDRYCLSRWCIPLGIFMID